MKPILLFQSPQKSLVYCAMTEKVMIEKISCKKKRLRDDVCRRGYVIQFECASASPIAALTSMKRRIDFGDTRAALSTPILKRDAF